MRWTLRQLADATGGTARGAATDGFGSLTIDSRRSAPGSVFVPIVAERDGHAFIDAAVAAGSAAYLYQPGRHQPVDERSPAVAVEDTGAALLDIGRAARERLVAPVVGITGSVGKTSTKDLTAAALGAAFRVTASAASFNNELGVPLTLANAGEDTEVAVLEMGARGVGHIGLLCDVGRPTVAVVTAVAAVHTELFGDLRGVARAKGELVEALPANGTAVLNGDDPNVAAMASRTSATVLRYGIAADSVPGAALDVVAARVTVDDDLRAAFELRSPWGAGRVALRVRGTHQVGNALAALTVALRLGVGLDAAIDALGRAEPSPWRMELATSPSGARILNDAYNANPTSTAAALEALHRLPARRRVAVLGVMAELGPAGPAEHRRIAALAEALGIEVVAVGTDDYGRPSVTGVEDAARLLGRLGDGDAVLVKGSRVAGLERLAHRLLAS